MNNKNIIPKIYLIPKTAYLTGVIIGDGNLANSIKSKTDLSPDYRITIDISDRKYMIFLETLIKSIIKTRSTPKPSIQRSNRIPRLYFQVRNKELFTFLNKTMEIPKGGKSSIVFVPSLIDNSPKEIKKYFLAGYFDTDGGFRGNSLGFTTASLMLNNGISKLLDEFKIVHSKEKWINKKYNKEFYGIRIKKIEIDRFLKIFPFKNKEKIERIYNRFNEEVPEWPNGIDYNKSKLRSLTGCYELNSCD